MAALTDVIHFLDTELRSAEIPDYDGALNGLQLANPGDVTRVAVAVDVSTEAIRGAVREGADLLIVHHGMFWQRPQRIVGPAYERLREATAAGLAIYSSHLPLDLHPTLGNNVLLARELQLVSDGTFGKFREIEIGCTGTTDVPTALLLDRLRQFAARFETSMVHTPFAAGHRTKRWAIITGAGASSSSFAEASARGVDTLIVGEGTHHTAVEARELGLIVVYAGHYATETLGVRALGALVHERFGVPWSFVNVPTGL
jgi:dinuclear metal center YbgI/SA1388 family protein